MKNFKYDLDAILFKGIVVFLLLYSCQSFSIEYDQPFTVDPFSNITRWNSFKELSGYGLNCMGQSCDSTMWFGTDKGAVSYDGINWVLHNNALGLRNLEIVTFLSCSNGEFFAANNSGLTLFNNNTWQPYLAFPDIFWYYYDVLEAPDHSLWIPMQFGFLQIIHDEIRFFTTENRIREYLRRKNNEIYFDNGKLFGPQDTLKTNDTVYLSDPFSSTRVTVFKIDEVEETYNIKLKPREMVYDKQRDWVWFTMTNGDIGYIDFKNCLEGKDFDYKLFTSKDGLVPGRLTRLRQTRDGSIWGISDDNSSGVNIYRNNRWEHFKLGDLGGYDNNCQLLEIDDEIWISGTHYLHILKNNKWGIYPFSRFDGRVPGNKTSIFQDYNKNIWFAGEDQFVVRFDMQYESKVYYDNSIFQFTDADSTDWYIHDDGYLLAFKNNSWKRYGVKDNIMSDPVKMVQQKNGNVWVAGSHNGRASTAVFRNGKWERMDHGDTSWSIEMNSLFVDRDDHVWFSGSVDFRTSSNYKGGILEYIPQDKYKGKWVKHLDINATEKVAYSITQTPDGRIWIGGLFGLRVYENGVWKKFNLPPDTLVRVDAVEVDPHGNLWVGTRGYGIFIYDGKAWHNIDILNGLSDNTIRDILFMDIHKVLVSTITGINLARCDASDYESIQWYPLLIPEELTSKDFNYLVKEGENSFWINRYSEQWILKNHPHYKNISHVIQKPNSQRLTFIKLFPETFIITKFNEISYKTSFIVNWRGIEPGKPESNDNIYYSYRIDDGPWSLFSKQRSQTFYMLEPGKHKIFVRSMNQDLNIDATPAVIEFKVLPSIWKQGWFLTLLITFLSIILLLISSIFRKNIELGKQNEIQKKQLKTIQEAQSNIASMAKFPNENPSPVLRIDEQGTILFANESSVQLLSEWNVQLGNRVPDHILDLMRKANTEGKVQEYIERCGNEIFYKLSITPIYGEKYYNIYGMEITAQIVFEDQLKKSLGEKEVLLKEIHHRVKNNLQIISSLLYLQARNHSNEYVQNIIEESRNRVKTIALVHERLYQSNDLSKIDFKIYMRGIVDHIGYLFKDKVKGINVVVDIPENVKLDLDRSIPCGLIVNELVTNAFKYAYPQKKGVVYLKLDVNGKSNGSDDFTKHVLSVWDEGVGISSDIDYQNMNTLGLRLVQNLVDQLDGEIIINVDNGTRFDISYKYPKKII